jgi:chaperonin GroES
MKFQGKTIIPLADKVIVKRNESEEVTPGGIVLPDIAKERAKSGKVLAVGDGKIDDNGRLIPLTIKEGDSVLFSSYSGNEVEINDQKLLIMSEYDVLAVIR